LSNLSDVVDLKLGAITYCSHINLAGGAGILVMADKKLQDEFRQSIQPCLTNSFELSAMIEGRTEIFTVRDQFSAFSRIERGDVYLFPVKDPQRLYVVCTW
jgi:hypothetical protein